MTVSESGNVVNVEEIMKEIEKTAYTIAKNDIPSFEECTVLHQDPENNNIVAENVVTFSGALNELKANAYNPFYTELGHGIKAFIKRIIRKVLKPIIFPMSERQNAYNAYVSNTIESAYKQIQDLQAQIEVLTEKTEKMSRALTIYRWRLFDHLGIEKGEESE